MKIDKHRLYQRGNIHARRLVIELQLTDAAGVMVPRKDLRKLPRALFFIQDQVPDCPAWRRLTRAKGPVPAAAAAEVLAVILQRNAFWPVRFCHWRAPAAPAEASQTPDTTDTADAPPLPPSPQDEGRAIFEVGSERTGLEAGKAGVALATALVRGASVTALHDLFFKQMELFLTGTNTATPSVDALQLARAGMKRGIPWSVVHRSQYLRLGTGCHSHVLKGTESTNTRSISRAVSRDKRLTHDILAEAGLPVARQRTARTESGALRQAAKLGYPLVVKPVDGNMGKGVTILEEPDDDRLVAAFHRAQAIARRVILETCIQGKEYRLLVVNGRFISAIHRSPAQVMGDGSKSVRDLVEVENARPERVPFRTGRTMLMKPIQMDDAAIEVLKDQGLTPDSIPAKDLAVFLRRESNLSRGGEPFDVTDRIHPSISDVAERASAVIGLDVCGVDFVTTDPGRPFTETGGAICELNSRPAVNGHVHTGGARGHRVTDAILDMLFPPGVPARLPVVALLGRPGQTRHFRRRIEAAATRAGVFLGAVTGGNRDTTLYATRRAKDTAALASDTQVQVAVVEITPSRLVRDGLGFEYVDLAVLADPDTAEGEEAAMQALTRIAGPRIVAQDDPGALARAVDALGLPATTITEIPAPITSPARPAARNGGDSFTALFAGDVGFGESYMHRARMADLRDILPTQGHGYSLERLQGLLGTADLSIANLEAPLAPTPDAALEGRKKYLGWSQADPALAALRAAGFGAFTLANNHMLDCGVAGLAETMTRLGQAKIACFGAGPDADSAAAPLIHRFTVGGIERSLVVFAGFEHRKRYDTRYNWYAGRDITGIGKLSTGRIARRIDALRGTLPEPVFIAFPHWGVDYAAVTDRQRSTAARLIDAGIDMVIGHGAHVVQRAELVKGCPVFYNIGNFVWNAPGRFDTRGAAPYGLAAALAFRADTASLRLYPIVTNNATTRFQNRPVTEDEFADAASGLSADLPGLLLPRSDAAGHHLEMTLPYRTPDEAQYRLTNSQRVPIPAPAPDPQPDAV